jgi:hypothetical protein
MVPDHGSPLGAARPIAAGPVVAGWECPAVGLRAGQDVVPVGRIASAVDRLALFVQRRLLADLVVGAVKIVDVLRDRLALRVLPRSAPDAITGIDGLPAARCLSAEVGAPGAAAGPRRLRQCLAVPVGALETAEVCALPVRRW